MKFRLAARLEILALSALGAAVAGCAGGPAYVSTKAPAGATIAATKIPAERILAVADVFEKQGNLAKAQELYGHVEKTTPELRSDVKVRTRELAQRRESAEPTSRRDTATRSRLSQTSYQRSNQRSNSYQQSDSNSYQRREISRGATQRAAAPVPSEEETERPAVETWATLKMRVSDRRESAQPQSVRKIQRRSPGLELVSASRKVPETDVDGWKASDTRSVQSIPSQTEVAEPEAKQEDPFLEEARRIEPVQDETAWKAQTREEPVREEPVREEEPVQEETIRKVPAQEVEEVQRESVEEDERLQDNKLITQLRSSNPDVRLAAALEIGQLESESASLMRSLRESLINEPTPRTRLQVADTMLRHSPRELEAFRVLLKSASDKDSETAAIARVMLSAHLAKNPTLIESQSQLLLRDNDPAVRSAAQWNLKVADSMRSEKTPKLQLVGGIAETTRVNPALAIRPAGKVK